MGRAQLKKLAREWFPVGSFGCFYCGVDSTPIIIFLVGLIGSLVLGTVFLGVSFAMRGRFQNTEEQRFDVFEAEQRS